MHFFLRSSILLYIFSLALPAERARCVPVSACVPALIAFLGRLAAAPVHEGRCQPTALARAMPRCTEPTH